MKKIFFIFLILAGAFASFNKANAVPAAITSADPAKLKAKSDSLTTAKLKAVDSAKLSTINTAKTKAITCLPPTSRRQWAGWILIVLITGLFIWVAWGSDLLRDPVMDPVSFMAAAKLTRYAAFTDIGKIPKSFSLARTQLGVWTVIISCSYIYLGLIAHFSLQDIVIDSTILSLMGISAGTAAAGSVIDNSASSEQQGQQYPSDNFLMDILSDQNGINIHRFQNVIWTIIAMTLFIFKVRYTPCGELPTLDNTLIALTGISSATYLGLKINENKPPALPPPGAPILVPPPNPGPQRAEGPRGPQGI